MEKQLYDTVFKLQDKHWWFEARRNFTSRILEASAFSKKGLVLDIGCGSGSMLNFLAQYGHRTIGIDDSLYALSLAGKRGSYLLLSADVKTLPFPEESFDLVTSFEVLYHQRVEDDLMVLRELHRVCKKNARLVIIDSAFNFLKSGHDSFAHGARRYTLKELCAKLKSAGFTVKKASYIYMTVFPLVFILRAIKRLIPGQEKDNTQLRHAPGILNRAAIALLGLESRVFKKFNLPFGVSVFCLAQKV